jgi:hypothetical protein
MFFEGHENSNSSVNFHDKYIATTVQHPPILNAQITPASAPLNRANTVLQINAERTCGADIAAL